MSSSLPTSRVRLVLAGRLLVPVATLAFVAVAPGIASASWPATGAGAAAAKAGVLSPPSNVSITGCTASNKSAGIITGTVTVTWTVSSSAQVTGQRTYTGTGSPTTYTLIGSAIANNTTASATLSYSLAAATYRVGVAGTRPTAWSSVIAGSSNTFVPSTSGNNGSCSVA